MKVPSLFLAQAANDGGTDEIYFEERCLEASLAAGACRRRQSPRRNRFRGLLGWGSHRFASKQAKVFVNASLAKRP